MIARTPSRCVIVVLARQQHRHVLIFEANQWRQGIAELVRWHADYGWIDLETAELAADEIERLGRQVTHTQVKQQSSGGLLDKVTQIGKEMFARFLKGQ